MSSVLNSLKHFCRDIQVKEGFGKNDIYDKVW